MEIIDMTKAELDLYKKCTKKKKFGRADYEEQHEFDIDTNETREHD